MNIMIRQFRKIVKPRCIFCKQRTGMVKFIERYGIYGDVYYRHYYHNECLRNVLIKPVKYGHMLTDYALNIIDLIEEKKKSLQRERVDRKSRFKNAREKYVDSLFWKETNNGGDEL